MVRAVFENCFLLLLLLFLLLLLALMLLMSHKKKWKNNTVSSMLRETYVSFEPGGCEWKLSWAVLFSISGISNITWTQHGGAGKGRGEGGGSSSRPAPRNASRPIPASPESYHSNTRRQKGADEFEGGTLGALQQNQFPVRRCCMFYFVPRINLTQWATSKWFCFVFLFFNQCLLQLGLLAFCLFDYQDT